MTNNVFLESEVGQVAESSQNDFAINNLNHKLDLLIQKLPWNQSYMFLS